MIPGCTKDSRFHICNSLQSDGFRRAVPQIYYHSYNIQYMFIFELGQVFRALDQSIYNFRSTLKHTSELEHQETLCEEPCSEDPVIRLLRQTQLLLFLLSSDHRLQPSSGLFSNPVSRCLKLWPLPPGISFAAGV